MTQDASQREVRRRWLALAASDLNVANMSAAAERASETEALAAIAKATALYDAVKSELGV
jgi:hypothetical protein